MTDDVPATALVTVGHGTLDGHALATLLRGAGVGSVVDVRRFPGSRRDPSVSSDALATTLPAHGVGYRWDERLGGRRRVPPDQPPEVDSWWRHPSFRAYAAHMRTDAFRTACAELVAQAVGGEGGRTAVLCSESVWWRCHRRLVADAVALLHDHPVRHLLHDGRLAPHPPTEAARRTPDGLRYDARD